MNKLTKSQPPHPEATLRLKDPEWLKLQLSELLDCSNQDSEEYKFRLDDSDCSEERESNRALKSLADHYGRIIRGVLRGFSRGESLAERARFIADNPQIMDSEEWSQDPDECLRRLGF